MIKEIDLILTHWADNVDRRSAAQKSVLAQAMEFGGIPPRATGPATSKDPLRLGEMDDVSWAVEQALHKLPAIDQVMAHEHYRRLGTIEAKARAMGIVESSYYERIDRLHNHLEVELRENNKKAAANNRL